VVPEKGQLTANSFFGMKRTPGRRGRCLNLSSLHDLLSSDGCKIDALILHLMFFLHLFVLKEFGAVGTSGGPTMGFLVSRFISLLSSCPPVSSGEESGGKSWSIGIGTGRIVGSF